jgi:Cu(I)/Ag(I) efflux system membrane fusion protein/cobalt-zinc-cadmium efflux system membrane fusion protein
VSIDARRQQLIGVRIARAERRRASTDVRATGTVRFDETKETEINSRVDGWVRDLKANYTGMAVRTGDPLFTLYSPELLATENEFIVALRGRESAQQSALPEMRDHAERVIQAVRERLLFWEVSVAEIREMERRGRALGTTTFVSPASGVIAEKTVVEGMRITAGQRLFRLVDLSTVWVEAEVYERDLASVRVGQTARLALDAYPGEQFDGRVSYLYPSITEQTRTLRVRLQFDNSRGRLRPGMYANVVISGPAASALVVPADAVIDSGTEQVVFVTRGDGYFDPRPVKTGRRLTDAIEIVGGLEEGETVASGATFFLDSESQLRGALQNYQAPARASADAAAPHLDITFRTRPDPPRTGDVTFEAIVKGTEGHPVTDADVSAVLFMPAMPSMSHPAMRIEARLAHASEGTYRGTGQVPMAGRWDVTVNVSRDGQRVASRQLGIVAR